MPDGPYPHYTLIFCRRDEFGLAKVPAYPDNAEACEHARLRLLRWPEEWISVVIARGVDTDFANFEYIGSWDRDQDGALTWQAASLA